MQGFGGFFLGGGGVWRGVCVVVAGGCQGLGFKFFFILVFMWTSGRAKIFMRSCPLIS